MKYLKNFENLHEDGIDIDAQNTPAWNPAKSQEVKDYVDNIFHNGLNALVKKVCKETRIPVPKTDDELETCKQKVINYYIQNYEQIGDIKPPTHNRYPYMSGDGIARTNNIGGVHKDKFH